MSEENDSLIRSKAEASPSEKVQGQTLAEINYIAGKKAKASDAHEAARNYFIAGINDLIGEFGKANIWQNNYRLCYDLHLKLAEMHHLCTDFEEAERAYNLLEKHLVGSLDQVKVNILRTAQYTHNMQWELAVKCGLHSLMLLGFKIPSNVDDLALKTLWKAQEGNLDTALSQALDVSISLSEEQELTLSVFRSLVSPLYVMQAKLLLFVSLKITQLAIQDNFIGRCPAPLAVCGLLMGELVNGYEKGYQLAKQAYDLIQSGEQTEPVGLIYFGFALSSHWRRPLKEDFLIYQEGHQQALNEGDLVFASYCLGTLGMEKIAHGVVLDDVKKEMDASSVFLREAQTQAIIDKLAIQYQYIFNLKDRTNEGCQLSDKDFSAKATEKSLSEKKNYSTLIQFYLYQLQLAIFYQETNVAWNMARMTSFVISHVIGHIYSFEYVFFSSLAMLMQMEKDKSKESQYWTELKQHTEKLQTYADNCPENFLHAKKLIDAEKARLSGDFSKAIDCYDESIELSEQHGFLHHHALANEYAGRFWISRKKSSIAQHYLQKAYQAYKKWGATRKLRYMHQHYEEFSESFDTNQTQGDSSASQFDTQTLTNSVHIFSGQNSTKQLLQDITTLVMKNASADRVVLLLGNSKTRPDNINELQNIIERAAIIPPSNKLPIELGHSSTKNQPQAIANESSVKIRTEEEMKDQYRANIILALECTEGKISGKNGAAKQLGLKPTTLNSKIKSLNIDIPRKK